MLKDRFLNSNLSKLLTHRDFMEADYFLFLKSLCRQEKLCWCPRSCVYLYKTPRYILKSESQFFLNQFIKALSLKNSEDLTKLVKNSFTKYEKCFSNAIFIDIPLEDFDLNRLGNKK